MGKRRHIATIGLLLSVSVFAYGCGDREGSEVKEEGVALSEARDITPELNAFYAEDNFYQFATMDDLPNDLTWEDGSDLPDIGSPNAKKGGTYHEFVNDFPRTLRLVGPDSNGSFRSYIRDYTRVRYAAAHPDPGTGDFRLYPGLAIEWAVSTENKSVYVRLNPDARWSDGEEVTVEDVFFMFYFFRSPHIVAPWSNDYFSTYFTSVTKYDDYTFSVAMPEAKPDMAYKALNWSPIPAHFFKEFGTDYVQRYQWQFVPTTGAYIIKDEDIKKGRAVTMTRLDNWWAKDKKFFRNRFNFDKMRFTVIRDTPKAFESFKRGELDRFNITNSEYWYDKLPNSDSDVAKGYIHKSEFYYIKPRPSWSRIINESKPFLDNNDIRIGINYAANFDLVIEKYHRGDAVRMRTTADGYGPLTHPTLQPRSFDVTKAMEHFAKAGFSKRGSDGILVNDQGQRLSFTLTSSYERHKDVFTILREEALKAGLDLRIEVLDKTAGFKKALEKKHDIFFGAFNTSYEMYPRYWEPNSSDNSYDKAFLEDGSVNPDRKIKVQTNNLAMTANWDLDQLINQYRHNEDLEEMRRLAFEMEEVLYEDASYIPAWVRPYYRTGHWRWVKYPEGFNPMHSGYDWQFFVHWIDEDLRVETLAAMKKDEALSPEVNVYDQYRVE